MPGAEPRPAERPFLPRNGSLGTQDRHATPVPFPQTDAEEDPAGAEACLCDSWRRQGALHGPAKCGI